MRYFAEVAYLGTNYHGWQSQKNAVAVQDEIERAIEIIRGEKIKITGSGRTDKGVHAVQQFFHFDVEGGINTDQFRYKLNALLKNDIQIRQIKRVNDEVHARFDAGERAYVYRICKEKDPFLFGQSYRYYRNVDLDIMNQAASLLIGEHDFECFSRVKTDVNHFICEVFEAYWEAENKMMNFHISANRFLRGMVRAVVGTLLLVGEKKISISDFENILLSGDRKKAGRSVPPEGLFLVKVEYSQSIFK